MGHDRKHTIRAPVVPGAIVVARAVLDWPYRRLPPVGILQGHALYIAPARHAHKPGAHNHNVNVVQLMPVQGKACVFRAVCPPECSRQACRGHLGLLCMDLGNVMYAFVCFHLSNRPRLEVLEVLQDGGPEGLQHLSLHILSWKQGQHLDGQVQGLTMHIQCELSSGVGAIAGQHDLGVPP